MEKPRSWTYTGLRNATELAAIIWRYKLRGVPFAVQGVFALERVALRLIDLTQKAERLTYPSRWERIANDSINPP